MQRSANRQEAPDGKREAKLICGISGRERRRRGLVALVDLLASLAERIRADHPDLAPDALISRGEVARYRKLHVEELLKAEHGELTELDRHVAESIAKHETVTENVDVDFDQR